MAEQGDMFFNRKSFNAILRALIPRVIRFGEHERFSPDVLLAEGDSLASYGLDAKVILVPGHSRGSIAIGPDGRVYSSIRTDNETGFGKGYLHRLVRYDPRRAR